MTELTIADVGVERFNNDHQRLLFYVVEFTRLAKRFKEREPFEDEWDQVDAIFPRLEKYTHHHFEAEEAMMREHDYPHLDLHVKQHHHLVLHLKDLKAGVADRRNVAIARLESFLEDWLRQHINQEDVRYRGLFQLAETREIVHKALFNEMISAGQLHQVVAAPPGNVVLIDLRTETEQLEGIIPGSHLYPCDHNLENRQDTGPFEACFGATFDADRFDADKWYVLICRSGPRTEIALEKFLDEGLKACELIGGIEEWKRQNYPVSPFLPTTPRIR
ncbi:MAG: hemerythrin domain-containing protein [Magnetococcales bacterium]|nr:hemerythrin domain-containing protein [Magnetococcales bacterium]